MGGTSITDRTNCCTMHCCYWIWLPYTQHNLYALCRNPSIKQSVEELKQTTESLRERQALLLPLHSMCKTLLLEVPGEPRVSSIAKQTATSSKVCRVLQD